MSDASQDRQTIVGAMLDIREQAGDEVTPDKQQLLDQMAQAAGDPQEAKQLAELIRSGENEPAASPA